MKERQKEKNSFVFFFDFSC